MNQNDVAPSIEAEFPRQVDCFMQSLSHRGQGFILNRDWELENFRGGQGFVARFFDQSASRRGRNN